MPRPQFRMRRIANARTVATAARDEETGGAVAVVAAAASACRNLSLPSQLQNRPAPIDRKERIVQKDRIVPKGPIVPHEASAPNTVRRRDTNRSCCPESQSQSISVWRRISPLNRERHTGLSRKVRTHRSPLLPRFLRMSRCSHRPQRTTYRNRKTERVTAGQKAQPRTLKSDLPTGVASKSVCMK
jgi:hypothetical protein